MHGIMFDFTLRDRQTDAHMVLTIYIRIIVRSQTHPNNSSTNAVEMFE